VLIRYIGCAFTGTLMIIIIITIIKDIVMLGEKLNDKHMNFAQALIKKQFDNLSGLHSTLTIFQLQAPIVSENVLQVLHIGGGIKHWLYY